MSHSPSHTRFALLACFLVPALISALSGCTLSRASSHSGITIEAAVFEGGFGIKWHKRVAREYEKLHPDVKVNLWGDPRVEEKIKPRILRRDPPDVVNCNLPVWKLITADKLYPLDETLNSPAYGQNMTWRQSIMPGLLSDFRYQGKTYALPSNFGIWVGWYDRKLFRDHGWSAPKTWSEFTALCDKIKAAGIGPIAFQGKYPDYAWSTILAVYQRQVPFEKWYAMQDLKPGAFTEPEWINSAKLMQEMAQKYFLNGSMAMTHTEAQMEWCNRRAAICFCGLWLKHEMKDNLPKDFEMDCFAVPIVDGGKGDPNAVYGQGGENFFVFREAKHPREAADFLKYMVSMGPAHSYIQELDTLSPVKGSTKGLKLSSDLAGAVDIQSRSTRNYHDRLGSLYLDFSKNISRALMADLLSGKITPEQYGQRMEQGAELVRRNPDIFKPPAMGVPALE